MNVSASTNAYYIDKSSGTTIHFITTGNNKQSLPAELTPREVLKARAEPAVKQPSKDSNQMQVAQKPPTEKVVYELDGQEINPVDILFQKHPPTKEEKFRDYLKSKGKNAKLKLARFKELNERIIAQNEANPLELDVHFRKTLSGLKRAAKQDNKSKVLKESKEKSARIHIKKRESRRESKPSSMGSGTRNTSSEFNPFPNLSNVKPFESNVNITEPPQHTENHQEEGDVNQPPIAGNSISKAIWNCLNYYWVSSKANPSDQEKQDGGHDATPVIRKVYKRQKNGLIMLVESVEGSTSTHQKTISDRQLSSAHSTPSSTSSTFPASASASASSSFLNYIKQNILSF